MSNKRCTDEFKIEAVKQVTERCHTVTDVAARLDASSHSLPNAKQLMTSKPNSAALKLN